MTSIRIGAPLNSEPIPKLQWVEVASSFHIPSFQIVGLPSQEIHESRERVRAAIESSGFDFPRRRLVLNLSPASVRKQGTGIDLAIALSILASSHSVLLGRACVAWGELGLDGTLKSSGQILRGIYAAWDAQVPYLLFPRSEESSAVEKLDLLMRSGCFKGDPPVLVAVGNLNEAWTALKDLASAKPNLTPRSPPRSTEGPSDPLEQLLPLSPAIERVLGIAAAGGHHILLLGPRGSGKSHAMEWLAALQPPMPALIEMTQTLMTEMTGDSGISRVSRVRKVGVQVKPAALIGSASSNSIRPGEFSLAHGGLLIADEFPEWARDSRESLREPLERGSITLNRARGSMELPAKFTLAATGNFCPCGGWPARIPLPAHVVQSERKYQRCTCPKRAKDLYLTRISGPVLDRTDIVLLMSGGIGSGSKKSLKPGQLKSRVQHAYELMLNHYGDAPSRLHSAHLEDLLSKNPEWECHLRHSDSASLRSRHKILRLALSLAAWDGVCGPTPAHFAEAYCYRAERLGLHNSN